MDGFAQNTRFILSEDDEALLAKGLIAEFSPQNLEYYISGNALYMQTGLNVPLAESPKAPEPSTCTLSLLALAAAGEPRLVTLQRDRWRGGSTIPLHVSEHPRFA